MNPEAPLNTSEQPTHLARLLGTAPVPWSLTWGVRAGGQVLFCYEQFDELTLLHLKEFDKKKLISVETDIVVDHYKEEKYQDSKPGEMPPHTSLSLSDSLSLSPLCSLCYPTLTDTQAEQLACSRVFSYFQREPVPKQGSSSQCCITATCWTVSLPHPSIALTVCERAQDRNVN